MLGAGLDTVVNAMGFGMQHVARHPDLQDRLRAEPKLIPDAVEELLRRYSVSSVARRVTRDADFHGAPLKAGEYVALPLPLGNLDPKAFPDPDRFDLERENKVHMTFNSGPHRCVGSHLARLELNVLYDEWLKRMPNVRPDPDKSPRYRAGTSAGAEDAAAGAGSPRDSTKLGAFPLEIARRAEQATDPHSPVKVDADRPSRRIPRSTAR